MAGQRVLVPFIGVRVLSPEQMNTSSKDHQPHVDKFHIDKVTTKRLSLFTGRTHPDLASEVADHLGVRLGDPNIVEFANGEIRPRFSDSVRGGDVFVMQTH